MARQITWVVLGSVILSLTGCEDPKQPVGVQNAQPAAAAAPAGANPGAGGAGPAAMPGMGPPSAPAAATASAATATKDPLVYIPANVTFAVGGLPSAVAKSPNKVAGAFLSQFSPLTSALERVGLPPQGIESFWAAANSDLTEQAMCIITTIDINQEAIKQVLGADKIPKDSRIWPLPGAAAETHGLALADSRTLIIGRKSTVDAALRKSPPLMIKQGLGTINQVDADFWMAGDSAAAQTYFSGGLPVLGRYSQSFDKLKAFGIGMILDGKTLTANAGNSSYSANGMMNPMGMSAGGPPGMPAGGPPGMASPMPAAGANPMASPMPGAAANPMASPMPGAAANPMASPMPMGAGPLPMPMGAAPMPMPMSTNPNAVPATTAVAATGSTDQFGITVQGGFLFESDTAATAGKAPLDQFLTTAARNRLPKPQRYIPDLLSGSGGANTGAGGAMAAMPTNPGANMSAPPMGPMGPNGGYPNSTSNQGGSVAVIPEPAAANANPMADLRLQPTQPPTPQSIADPNAAPPAGAAGQPGANPMSPMGPMAPASPMSPASPMGPMAPMAPASPMGPMDPASPMGPMGSAPANYGSGGAYPNSMGSGQGGGGQWTYQQLAFVQFAYRFDARDENIAFAGHVMHAMGTSPFGDPLNSSPLAALHKALQEARGPANAAGAQGAGFGPRGTSWMIHLLPFLGHQAVHKLWDPKKPLTDPANFKVSHAVIPQFLNPADPRQQWVGAPYADMGLTHFVGMSGVEDDNGPPAATLDRTDPKAGVFGYKQIATPEMITDGQSQTIMMLGGGDLVSPWAVGGGATIRGARSKSFEPRTGFGSTGGPKPGTFVLFADGSVRFVSAEIDEQVFKAMSTTHGQDSVDLPALQGAGTVIGK